MTPNAQQSTGFPYGSSFKTSGAIKISEIHVFSHNSKETSNVVLILKVNKRPHVIIIGVWFVFTVSPRLM